jgi:RNA polymerase primary sigma factor
VVSILTKIFFYQSIAYEEVLLKHFLIGGRMSRDNYSLDPSIEDLCKYPPLSRAEEQRLAIRSQNGDPDAREKLIRHNVRFVVKVAKRFQGMGLPLDDLISEGNLGLVIAAERFKPNQGKFISYAVWWIRQSIFKALSQGGRILCFPINHGTNRSRIRRIISSFEGDHGRSPTIEEVSNISGIDQGTVKNLIGDGVSVSLDAPVTSDGKNHGSLYTNFVDPNGEQGDALTTLEERGEKRVKEKMFYEALRRIQDPVRNVMIFLHLQGIFPHSEDPPTQKEVSDIYGITRERVRQISNKVMEHLCQELFVISGKTAKRSLFRKKGSMRSSK